MNKKQRILMFFLGSIGALHSAVITAVDVDASSWFDDEEGSNSTQWVGNLTNNSGISEPYDITATHVADTSAEGMWHAKTWSEDPNPLLTFDLGGAYDLSGIYIWNGNQALNEAHIQRGVNEFVLSTSSDGSNYSTVGTFNLTVSPLPAQSISAQNFDLSGQNGITHVQLVVNSTHNSPSGGGDYASLSEVMFTAIPEPNSTLLVAVGLLGFLIRRRR